MNIEDVGPFDPTNHCVKCGNKIQPPEPVEDQAVTKKTDAEGKTTTTERVGPPRPPAPPPPPNVTHCYGVDCPWFHDVDITDDSNEHMHAICPVCGYEWLTRTLDAK